MLCDWISTKLDDNIQQLSNTERRKADMQNVLALAPHDEPASFERRLFLPARHYATAGNRDRNVSVCPSVCLSRAGIVSKRRKLAA